MTKLLFVEGVIGCGKTTCLQNIERYIAEHGLTNVQVVYEPVELWQSLGLLHNFYTNKARWAYTFQNMAFITKMMLLEDLDPAVTYVIERSPHVDRCVFAKLCHETGDISDQEWRLYNLWYDHYMAQFGSKYDVEFVYIEASPETCLQRAKERSREDESSIPLAYFQALAEKHEDWLSDPKLTVHRVDGKKSPEKILDDVLHFF